MSTTASLTAPAPHQRDAAASRIGARPGTLRSRFSLRSLRIRLVLIVLAIDAVAAALTGGVIIFKARAATRLEIASSMQLAEMLVADTIQLLKDSPPSIILKSIDLHFQSVRHVRIAVIDAAGHPIEARVDPAMQSTQNAATPDAPAWFSRLAAPEVERRNYPIVVAGEKLGTVIIRSEPDDEVGEAWNYAYALLVTALLLNLAVLGTLFLLFGRVLAPLTRLGSGLKNIESRNYAVRLPPPSLLELATITDLFNSAAEDLDAAQGANRHLHRKLLTAQDDERRRTALELHDEVGPCLFALEANATSITNMTRAAPDARLRERAQDVVALVGRVQGINRRVLDRLRPMALGQIPLADSLARLLIDFEGGDDAPAIEPRIGPLQATYGRLVDLTIYRCVQEGLFNAVRHARAARIVVGIEEVAAKGHVSLRIEDDGRGLVYPLRAGLGLSGMRERVEALNGAFEIQTSGAGTILAILIPLDSPDDMPEDGTDAGRRAADAS